MYNKHNISIKQIIILKKHMPLHPPEKIFNSGTVFCIAFIETMLHFRAYKGRNKSLQIRKLTFSYEGHLESS